MMNISVSDQIRKALSEKGKSQRELADLVGLSLRQVQRKLKLNNWTVQEVEAISRKLSWPFSLGAPSDDVSVVDSFAEEKAEYMSYPRFRKQSPIRLTIEIDPPDGDFGQVPAFVKSLQDAFEEFQREQRQRVSGS